MKIHVNRSGQPLGQFTPDEVREGWRSGRFIATDLAWRDGMASWQPLAEVIDELAPDDTAAASSPPSVVAPSGPAWEQRAQLGFMPAVVESIRAILLEPGKAFSTMRETGGYGAPLFFFVLLGTIGGLVGVFYNVVLQVVGVAGMPKDDVAATVFGSALGIGLVIMLLPVMFVATAFVSAGLIHLSLMIIGGAKKPFEATFRVACYSGGATAVFQLLPVCGAIVASVYNFVLMVKGLSQVHSITTLRASIAVILPTLVCCGLVFGLIAVGTALGVAAANQ